MTRKTGARGLCELVGLGQKTSSGLKVIQIFTNYGKKSTTYSKQYTQIGIYDMCNLYEY